MLALTNIVFALVSFDDISTFVGIRLTDHLETRIQEQSKNKIGI